MCVYLLGCTAYLECESCYIMAMSTQPNASKYTVSFAYRSWRRCWRQSGKWGVPGATEGWQIKIRYLNLCALTIQCSINSTLLKTQVRIKKEQSDIYPNHFLITKDKRASFQGEIWETPSQGYHHWSQDNVLGGTETLTALPLRCSHQMCIPWSWSRVTGQIQIRGLPTNNWPIAFKHVKVTKRKAEEHDH